MRAYIDELSMRNLERLDAHRERRPRHQAVRHVNDGDGLLSRARLARTSMHRIGALATPFCFVWASAPVTCRSDHAERREERFRCRGGEMQLFRGRFFGRRCQRKIEMLPLVAQ